MMYRSQKRPGVSLIEVLIATFILAIGMLAIMALFPVGALNMARAINQNRAADHGANSDAQFRYQWKKAWLDPNGGGVRSQNDAIAASSESMLYYLDRSRDATATQVISPSSGQPSFPLMVDPIGRRTQSGTMYDYVAGQAHTVNLNNGTASIPMPGRVSLAAAEADPRMAVRLTTLQDEFAYDLGGEPSALSGQLDRGGRYNTSWLIQRPKNNVPHEVHLHVLVFAGRSPTDTPSSEVARFAEAYDYEEGIDPKPNSVTVDLQYQPKPAVKRGSWVAFVTQVKPRGASGVAYPAIDFYRISSVTEVATIPPDRGELVLEFEQPLRTYGVTELALGGSWAPAAGTPLKGTVSGQIVVFENLLEVFDRGIVSVGSISGR